MDFSGTLPYDRYENDRDRESSAQVLFQSNQSTKRVKFPPTSLENGTTIVTETGVAFNHSEDTREDMNEFNSFRNYLREGSSQSAYEDDSSTDEEIAKLKFAAMTMSADFDEAYATSDNTLNE